MEIVISNQRWFSTYLIIRNSVLLLTGIWLVSQLLISDQPLLLQYLSPVAISLLLVLLLFDFIQKPSLFEVIRKKDDLEIRLFHPDTRYFIRLNERFIQTIQLQPTDRLEGSPAHFENRRTAIHLQKD